MIFKKLANPYTHRNISVNCVGLTPMSFISYLMDRTLTLRLHKNQGPVTSDVVTHKRLYERLSSCQVDRIEVAKMDHSATNLTRATKEQRELLTRIGLKNLLNYKAPV